MDEKQKYFENDPRPLCKYSPKCYQKNQEHAKKFKHAPVKNFSIFNFPSNNKRKLKEMNDANDQSREGNSLKCSKMESNQNNSVVSNLKCSKTESNPTNTGERMSPTSKETLKKVNETNESLNDEMDNSVNYFDVPANINEFIKDKFKVEMPNDFYKFWEFYKYNKKNSDYMKKINLKIIGPFDVLQGTLPIRENSKDYLLHWRHFYDPPEFQTILMSTVDEFHMGYYRDSPTNMPCFVASNTGKDCKIEIIAENIFGALIFYVKSKGKDIKDVFTSSELDKFVKNLKQFATENNFTVETNSASIKKRSKSVNARTFHGAGIVVPYDKKTQVGYRSLAEKDDTIKKILKSLVTAKSDTEKNSARSLLQPIITLANIANDECDFGTGLELGIDLFCYGDAILHTYVKNLLITAYDMLDRDAFGEIIKVHLENRRKGSDLSISNLS